MKKVLFSFLALAFIFSPKLSKADPVINPAVATRISAGSRLPILSEGTLWMKDGSSTAELFAQQAMRCQYDSESGVRAYIGREPGGDWSGVPDAWRGYEGAKCLGASGSSVMFEAVEADVFQEAYNQCRNFHGAECQVIWQNDSSGQFYIGRFKTSQEIWSEYFSAREYYRSVSHDLFRTDQRIISNIGR